MLELNIDVVRVIRLNEHSKNSYVKNNVTIVFKLSFNLNDELN